MNTLEINTLQVVLIFIGLSLDSFVITMRTGATLKGLKEIDFLKYSFIFAGVATAATLLGYIASFFKGIVPDTRIQIGIAALIIMAIGIFIMTRCFKNATFEEKLDKDFNYKKCVRLAILSSIDVLCLAVGFNFLGFNILMACVVAFTVTFIVAFIALHIGYNLGAGYSRTVGMLGGALMVAFSIYIMAACVLSRMG